MKYDFLQERNFLQKAIRSIDYHFAPNKTGKKFYKHFKDYDGNVNKAIVKIAENPENLKELEKFKTRDFRRMFAKLKLKEMKKKQLEKRLKNKSGYNVNNKLNYNNGSTIFPYAVGLGAVGLGVASQYDL